MQIYRVGGYVRDKLLGIKATDCDYVVVGSTPEQMLELGYKPVGKSFPVFLHPKTKDEYALARTEKKSGMGHTGFSVYFAPHITLEEDLSRRDLTINAIAEASDGNLIDPYHGIRDLKQKILRHVSPAFVDDPLRILRIARFAAKLDFHLAPETAQLLISMAKTNEGRSISRERMVEELSKALTTAYPAQFFIVLRTTNNLAVFFPQFAKLINDELDWNKFITQINLATNYFTRWIVIASFLNTTNIKPQINELVIDNYSSKMINHANLLHNYLSTSLKNSATQLLELFRKLDLWRNFVDFSKLTRQYSVWLEQLNKNTPIKADISKLYHLIQLANLLYQDKLPEQIINNPEQKNIAEQIQHHRIQLINFFETQSC